MTAKQATTEQITTEEKTKKPRAKKTSITMSEAEASELKALAENLHLSESELIKIAIKAIAANANIIHAAQEKTAYPVEMIVTNGISRYSEQLVKQDNIGSQNGKIAQKYDELKAIEASYKEQGKKPPFRSIISKLTTMTQTNYNTVKRWLELNHPEELNETK